MEQPTLESTDRWPWTRLARPALFAVLVLIALTIYVKYGRTLNLESLAAHEGELRDLQARRPGLVLGVAFLIYVCVTGLSLPGATVLTLIFAWFFGFLHGVILVSFASTSGATLAFLLSRYLFRDAILARLGHRVDSFQRNLEKEGAFYLFASRLMPAIPFFVINLVMGLTRMRATTFWWVSQLGMLPATIVYVYAGSRVPSLTVLAEQGGRGIVSWQLLAAFTLLGLFPLATKTLLTRRMTWQRDRG